MASGRPILTNVKMGYNLLEKYNCGISAEDETLDAYVAAIKKIRSLAPQEYETLCQNALRAAKDFDYKNLSDALLAVIDSVCK